MTISAVTVFKVTYLLIATLRLTADPLIHHRNVLAVCHIGLDAVSKLSYTTYGCTACNAIRKPKYATHTREKRNARNRCYPCVRCIFHVRALRFFDLGWSTSHNLHALHPLRCIQQLGNRPLSLQPYMRFASCRMKHTQCNAIKKPKHATHAREKHNARNRFYPCVRCIFRVHVLRTLHCIRQLGSWPLNPFSAFCFDVRHV